MVEVQSNHCLPATGISFQDGFKNGRSDIADSSGAAHGPPPIVWFIYGISKASFYQEFNAMDEKFKHLGGSVGVDRLRIRIARI